MTVEKAVSSTQIEVFNRELKSQDVLHLTFSKPFTSPPIVLVTPVYSGQVAHEECVIETTVDGVRIKSGNKAPDYYVNILAISPGPVLDQEILAFAGEWKKNFESAEIPINLGEDIPRPVIIRTSKWTDRVLYIDTINKIIGNSASETSQNISPDYFTNYLSIKNRRFKFGGKEFQCGIINKTTLGTIKVLFDVNFSKPPTVFLSPFWETPNGKVLYTETVIDNSTDNHSFLLDSQNSQDNYYVFWLAIL